jgi:DNA-directed RNA polymerase specialized sigma24 family protein
MSTLAQNFEDAWAREQRKLRHYFFRYGVASTEIDDRLQDVALKLWTRYGAGKVPENFSGYSMAAARSTLIDYRRAEMRRARWQCQLEEYEAHGIPFGDIWGRRVPVSPWEAAEVYSLAPLRAAEILDQLKSLISPDYPIFYYLSEGATLQDISEVLRLPVPVLRYWLTLMRRFLWGEVSAGVLRNYILRQVGAIALPSTPALPLQIQRFNTANYLRQLPGFVPEWILWFGQLSAHTADTDEPITFGLIQRLARETGILSEKQGKRFLLAATSDEGGLLTQKFFEIIPSGESRLLSFSDISQLLRKETVVDDEATGSAWMDQIATAWEPTSKWGELTARDTDV